MSGIWNVLTSKLWDWYKRHDGDTDAHHTKYTDAEAIAGVAADDRYVRNTTDYMSGRFGIGTSSPQTYLHVNGYARIDGFNTSALFTSARPRLMFASSPSASEKVACGSSWDSTRNFAVYTKSSGDFLASSERLTISLSGNVGINTCASSPTTKLDINSDKIRLRTSKTPSSATDTGNQGDICWDASYVYVCTATNTWKRSALSTW